MFPDKCSVKESGKPCLNPPQFVISVVVGIDEYMVGVTCVKHKGKVSEKLEILQTEGNVPRGKIKFSELKAVGTDCIKGDSSDLIQL